MPRAHGMILLALLTLLKPASVFAWGKVGHESVALIAEKQIKSETKIKIKEVLGSMSLADSSNWPDKIKSDSSWAHASPYHYTGVSDGNEYWKQMNALSPEKQSFGDVIRALVKAEDLLRDPLTTNEEKFYALNFLVHLVGDLHQPLHTGRPEDRGGNDVRLLYYGRNTNLHAIWDIWIIGEIIRSISSVLDPESATEAYLKQLRIPNEKEISNWTDSYIIDWLNESIQPRKGAYAETFLPNEKYQEKYSVIVNESVLRGGYRLAAWLDAIFSNAPYQSEKYTDIRKKIKKVFGKNSDQDIYLAPHQVTPSQRAFIKQYYPDFCGHEHSH